MVTFAQHIIKTQSVSSGVKMAFCPPFASCLVLYDMLSHVLSVSPFFFLTSVAVPGCLSPALRRFWWLESMIPVAVPGRLSRVL